ncbi:hypothetical protein [Bosea sp. PAMC 26642]|uniref:hypothetical protein n=1 Tax=Bosea sp. (strain PAMC 26642) TaxID=1792307 RepID=UPI0012E781D9|nr:hypothetical protein [Bosea sp. PAMC 26642]
MPLLIERMQVQPDVARSGQRAVSLTLIGGTGGQVRAMLSRAQAADLAKMIRDALARETR